MNTPRLGTYNEKYVDIYIAADAISMMFGKTRICNQLALEKGRVSYSQVAGKEGGKYVQRKVDNFDNEFDAVIGERANEWGKYHCDMHILMDERGPYVLADAGFFRIKVFTDSKGHFVVKYRNVGVSDDVEF